MRDQSLSKPFNKWVSPKYSNRETIISEYVKPGSRVLNFGCGTGRLSFLKNCEVVNYDIDRHNLIADYNRLEDVPGVFDAVVLKEVAEHMTLDVLKDSLSKISMITSMVILTTPHVCDLQSMIEFKRDITHVDPYNTPYLETLLNEKGFTVVHPFVCEPFYSPYRIASALFVRCLPFSSFGVVGCKC